MDTQPADLAKAIEDGHVGVSDNTQGRVFVLLKQCSNPDNVMSAIALQNKVELAWVTIASGVLLDGPIPFRKHGYLKKSK